MSTRSSASGACTRRRTRPSSASDSVAQEIEHEQGALVGSLLAVFAVRKIAPLRLAGYAALAFVLPLWVLPFLPPWPVVFAALFTATLFTPLINGPIMAVLTARTPPELRAKVMTAVISVNTLAAPLGFLLAGQVLDRWGVVPLFTAVVLGMTCMVIVFASIVLRHRDADVVGAEPAML